MFPQLWCNRWVSPVKVLTVGPIIPHAETDRRILGKYLIVGCGRRCNGAGSSWWWTVVTGLLVEGIGGEGERRGRVPSVEIISVCRSSKAGLGR